MNITNKAVSSNPAHAEVYPIQHYVIKLVSYLRQVGDFLWVLRFPSTNKTDHHDVTEILLKVALKKNDMVLASWREILNSSK